MVAIGHRSVSARGLYADGDDRRVFLSFDHNHENWYLARPLFDECDVRATFYTNTCPFRDMATPAEIEVYLGRIGAGPTTSRPLTTDELRALAEDGHTIGAHGHSHRVLSRLGPAEAESDIRTSKDRLEELIGGAIADFAYPYGLRRYFTESLRRFCLENNFSSVANAVPGLQHAGHIPSRIERTPWQLNADVEHNLQNLRIDGRRFERLTGRTAVPF